MNINLRKTSLHWVVIAILILLSSLSLRFFGTTPATAAGSLQQDSLKSIVSESSGVNEASHFSRETTRMATLRPLKTRQGTATSHIMSLDTTKRLCNTIFRNTSAPKKGEKKLLITNAQCENLRSLVASDQWGQGIRVHFNPKNGTPAFIKLSKRTRTSNKNIKNLSGYQSAAEKFLTDNRILLKLSDPKKELVQKRRWMDRLGTKHFRYQQTYNGIPLWGKELMVHLNESDSVYLCQGRYEPTPELLDTTPEITVEQALEAAGDHLGITTNGHYPPKTELVIYTASDGGKTLAYKVDISPSLDQRWLYFVDADTGAVIHRINNLHNTVENASGGDLNSVNRAFNVWLEQGTYYLVDPTFPLDNTPYDPVPDVQTSGNTYIFDARNGESDLYYITSSAPHGGWDRAGVSAAYNTKTIYDYYKNTFDRNGIDDLNMSYLMVIHLKENYANAFWNGKFVCFGDGDNQTFSALSGSLDITAHEIQHGVTEFTAGLIYENQSGALNEGYSDIFACMVDRDDWTVGEDVTLVSPGYLRSLANPALGLDPLPTKMSEYRNLPNTQQGDYGGVHVNMGIPSRAAYLMAEGLTAEGLGTSIGRDKTERIFFRALTTYLQAYSQFLDGRIATIQAAEDLYGTDSTEVSAVQASWDAVEVTEENSGAPEDQTPTSTESIFGDDLMVYLYPTDGTHDKPYDLSEKYKLYVQTIPSPFTGYDSNLDVGPLNTLMESLSYTRPSAYTGPEGTMIFYVGSDYNLYAVDSKGNDTRITETRDIWSFAISSDGSHFVYTTVYVDDNNIYVGDLETELVTQYPVESPNDLPPGSQEGWNTIFYVDTLAFDYTGKTIVFDALNCFSTPENPCDRDNGGYKYWSIGFLNLSNGSFEYPFPEQSPDFDVEYPGFAYNNNFVVVLDILDYSDYAINGTVSSMVWTMNLQTQASAQIGNPNLGSNTRGVAGVPSFWGDDDYVTIQRLSDTHGEAFRIPINASWAGNESAAQRLNDYDVALPVMHRSGLRTISGTIEPSALNLNFGNVSVGETSSLNLKLTNTGNRDINIYNIEISDSPAFSHNGSNALLPRDQSMTFRVTFSPGQTSGTLSGTLVITSDADSPSLSIVLIGTGSFENGGGFDYQSYLDANPDLPRSWGKAECMNHYIHYGFGENRAVSFNLDEYLNANPDLPGNWTYEQALNHYNLYGKNEHRLLAFDDQEYLSLYSDLPQNWSYDQAYNHFMNYGSREGRIASFDETAYLEMYSDLPQSWGQAEAFYHYFYYGIDEGRVYDPYDESVFV